MPYKQEIKLTEKSFFWCIYITINALLQFGTTITDQDELLIEELVRELALVEHDTQLIRLIKTNLNSLRDQHLYLSEIIPEYKFK